MDCFCLSDSGSCRDFLLGCTVSFRSYEYTVGMLRFLFTDIFFKIQLSFPAIHEYTIFVCQPSVISPICTTHVLYLSFPYLGDKQQQLVSPIFHYILCVVCFAIKKLVFTKVSRPIYVAKWRWYLSKKIFFVQQDLYTTYTIN